MSATSNTKIYLVETLVTFRHRYLIEASSPEDAEARLRVNGQNDFVRDEWQQKYLGELIITNTPITDAEIEEMQQSDENRRDGNPWMPVSRFIWTLEDNA